MKKKLLAVLTLTMLLVFSMTQMAWAAIGRYSSLTFREYGPEGLSATISCSDVKDGQFSPFLCRDMVNSDGERSHNQYEQVANVFMIKPGTQISISGNLVDPDNNITYANFTPLHLEGGVYHFLSQDEGEGRFYAGNAEVNFYTADAYMSQGYDENGHPYIFMLEKNVNNTSGNISIILNGKPLNFSQAPYMANDTTMVPMRVIFEALGADVNYDSDSQKITATKGDIVVELMLGEKSAKKNGENIALDAAAVTKNGNTMVPLRFVAEALQAQVDWNGSLQIIAITLK